MLLIHGTPATASRYWDHNATKLQPKLATPSNLAPGASSQDADSDVFKTPEPESSIPASASSDGQVSTSRSALQYDTPILDPDLSSTTIARDPYSLDTATFPFNAVHLLPSEPNGTWRTHVGYAVIKPSEAVSRLEEVVKEHVPKFDVPTTLHKISQAAGNTRDGVERWLNQTLADQDLGEIHNRVLHLVHVPSMPNIRQIDQAVDAVAEIGQSLRRGRFKSKLLEEIADGKYIFAEVVCRKARRALVEQGICKNWQLQSADFSRLQYAMHVALLHTFTRIRETYIDVPLFRAQPQWIAERETKVWRLELHVGAVCVEVGPVTDRSLIEFGSIDTGFKFPESSAYALIADIDRQVQSVEDDWQLVEA